VSEIEYTQGVCHDGAAILADGQMLTIDQVLLELKMCEHVKSLIKCQSCKGAGGGLGGNLGFYECPTCGGDGHRLHDMEGESIRDLIDYEELQKGGEGDE
tara:strand:- start:1587 stop:1886 length:300 start_codon:yes stop_codon:yes gene_type:complete